jgi:hypothetical protein
MQYSVFTSAFLAALAAQLTSAAPSTHIIEARNEVDVRASCWRQIINGFSEFDRALNGKEDGLISKTDISTAGPRLFPGVCTGLVLGRDFDDADNIRGGNKDGLVGYWDARAYLEKMSYTNPYPTCC